MRWARQSWGAAGIVGLWTAAACYRLDLPGLQYDETLFALALYPAEHEARGDWVERLMLMPYMGALKAWIYALWLPLLSNRDWAVRLPMVLLSAATLVLIYRTLSRLLPGKSVLAVLALAAADPLYLLTSRYDWGPVVLQRLCFWGALAVLAGGVSRRRVFAAALIAGIGLFDKLSFHWLLLGGVAAIVSVYPGQARRLFRLPRAALALGGFALGSLPVWLYRLTGHGVDSVSLETDGAAILGKLSLARNSLAGQPLNAWIAHSYLEPEIIERFSPAAWVGFADWGTGGWLLLIAAVAFAGMLLLLWRGDEFGRLAAAGAVFCLVAGGAMFSVSGAGYLHHWALVAPVPQIAIGLVGVGLWYRVGARWQFKVVFVSMLAAQTLSIGRQYWEVFEYGGRSTWSAAIYRLEEALERENAPQILVADWGIENQLRLLSNGRLSTRSVSTEDDLRYWVAQPGERVFVAYFAGVPELFEGAQAKLETLAAEQERAVEALAVIEDRQSRPIYQISRIR